MLFLKLGLPSLLLTKTEQFMTVTEVNSCISLLRVQRYQLLEMF